MWVATNDIVTSFCIFFCSETRYWPMQKLASIEQQRADADVLKLLADQEVCTFLNVVLYMFLYNLEMRIDTP